MPENLAAREGVPRKSEHPYGKPYSTSGYNQGCRCEWCRKAKANHYKIKKGQEPLWAIPRAPGEAPPRPPGVVWIDASGITTVVRCERCDKNYGPWLYDESGAKAFQDAHNARHVGDPPFDWTAYDQARLMPHPGGRPPREDKPLCSEELCTEDSVGKGLCRKHYQRAYREARA